MTQIQTARASWAAPLPTPHDFAAYDQALPGAAERILRQFERTTDMAEKQQTHRLTLETEVVHGNLRNQDRGLWAATFIATLAISGGIYLAATGKETGGIATIVGALTALVGVFIVGKVVQVRELAEKRAREIANAAQPNSRR